jgi:hypothetical protein
VGSFWLSKSPAHCCNQKKPRVLKYSPILDKEFDYFSLRDQKDYREYFLLDARLALDRGDEKAAEKSFSLFGQRSA